MNELLIPLLNGAVYGSSAGVLLNPSVTFATTGAVIGTVIAIGVLWKQCTKK